MKRERRIAAQLLGGPHQEHVRGEREAMVPVLQVRRVDAGPFCQRPAGSPTGDRELHQGPHGTGRDGELTHGSGPFGTCGHESDAWRHSDPDAPTLASAGFYPTQEATM